ncbi:MAG: hypothetical protein IJ642_05110 [Oscillospiraceae bacterium]|nr:hypothetical protein [Oscillospiraceae bacterium]
MKIYIVFAKTIAGMPVSVDDLETVEEANRELQKLRADKNICNSSITYMAYDSEIFDFVDR